MRIALLSFRGRLRVIRRERPTRNALPQRNQVLVKLRPCSVARTAARADNQIDSRQLVLVKAKRLADYPSNPVPLDTAARRPNRHGKAEPRPAFVVPECRHAKESIAKPSAARIGRIEVRLTTQTLLRGEGKPVSGRAVASQAVLME
jgi:hypothetical protein